MTSLTFTLAITNIITAILTHVNVIILQLQQLRNINKKGGGHLLLFGNIRPSQPVNNRVLRTNITFRPMVRS